VFFSMQQSKAAITEAARLVQLHGVMRTQTARGTVQVTINPALKVYWCSCLDDST
jgi:hypothetical protein